MKFYTLEAVVKGETVKFTKAFNTRNSAIDYMFKYYSKHYMHDLVVSEEFAIEGDNHNIEYICDNNDRFRINRVLF